MKKSFTAGIALFLVIVCSFTLTFAGEKTEKELLQETVTLAKEVKAFGKTLGIEPTEAFTKSTLDKPHRPLLGMYLKKLGTITPGYDMVVNIKLETTEEITIKSFGVYYTVRGERYSYYMRKEYVYASEKDPMVIAPSVAKRSLAHKVESVLHEDLHDNMRTDDQMDEGIILPLGYLAAAEFFRHKNDYGNSREMSDWISQTLTMSDELNAFRKKAEEIFRKFPLDEARKRARKLIASYPTYARDYDDQTKDQHPDWVLEAKISHDLAYYTNFGRIVRMLNSAGDLKILIADLKKMPRNSGDLKNYLDALEKKYKSPTK